VPGEPVRVQPGLAGAHTDDAPPGPGQTGVFGQQPGPCTGFPAGVAFFSALFAAQPEGPPRLAVAADSYVGEGFDCSPLNALFLAAPVDFKGRLVQHAGRVLRSWPRKSAAEVPAYLAVATGGLASSPDWTRARLHRPSGSPAPVAAVRDDSGGRALISWTGTDRS